MYAGFRRNRIAGVAMTSNRRSGAQAAEFPRTVPDEPPDAVSADGADRRRLLRGQFRIPYHLGTGKPFVHRTS
jgi:hypothetical protein